MKRYFKRGFLILAMFFVAVSYTGAFFSDSVMSSGNTFTAGTWSTPARVVINEVLYDPTGAEPAEEWIEFYNAGGTAVDLGGYTITDNFGTFTLPSYSLGAGSYAVLATSGVSFNAVYGFSPHLSGSTLSLSNTGDYIILKDSTSIELDIVVWGTGSYGGITPHYDVAQGHSIARSPDGVDTDDCSVDFVDDNTPTPGGSNV
jgi:predicted ribosomally synthesized peptide with SipW-like signal peptide